MTTDTWIPADTFGTRLLRIRRDKGLTVDQAAAMCGVKPATWSSWERGSSPHRMPAVVADIAAAFHADRDWLMWGDGGSQRATDGYAVDSAHAA